MSNCLFFNTYYDFIMEDKQINKELKYNENSSEKKRFDTAVQFLLNCFDCVHHLEMTKVICFVMEDVRTCFFEMNSSSGKEAFPKVPYIMIDKLGFLKKKENARFDLNIVTKNELLLLFVVCHLSLNGKSHFEKVVKNLKNRAPQVVSMILSCASKPAKLSYLGKYPQYFRLDEDGHLELPSTFDLTFKVSFNDAGSFDKDRFSQSEDNSTCNVDGVFNSFEVDASSSVRNTSDKASDVPRPESNLTFNKFRMAKENEISKERKDSLAEKIALINESLEKTAFQIKNVVHQSTVDVLQITDRICAIVREGIVFLFEHFKCPFDLHLVCVVLHALHEAKHPFRLLSQPDQMALVKKIIDPLWVAGVEDNSGTFLTPSLETFELTKEQRDLLFISYVIGQSDKLHCSTLLRMLKKHKMSLDKQFDAYFKSRSTFFSIDEADNIKFENFPPAKWMTECDISFGNSGASQLTNKYGISFGDLPADLSEITTSVLKDENVIGEEETAKSTEKITKEIQEKSVSEYSQDMLDSLSEKMHNCVAYLSQFFQLNVRSGLLEVVMHVVKDCVLFFGLPSQQQIEVVKKSFRAFHIDGLGNIKSIFQKKLSTFKINKAVRMLLCLSYIISPKRIVHYRLVFCIYHQTVEPLLTNYLNDFDQLEYFKKREDIFYASFNGYVSLANVSDIKFDYVSILMSGIVSRPLFFNPGPVMLRVNPSPMLFNPVMPVINSSPMFLNPGVVMPIVNPRPMFLNPVMPIRNSPPMLAYPGAVMQRMNPRPVYAVSKDAVSSGSVPNQSHLIDIVSENCNISPVENPVLDNNVPVKTVSNIPYIVQQDTIDTALSFAVGMNVKEYPQKTLNSLSENIYATVTYLLKFFKLNLHSTFLEIILHIVKNGSEFFNLPLSQQEEVIKTCFRKLCIDMQGNVTSTFSNDKQTKLSKTRRQRLFIWFKISEKGPMHYREVFKNYQMCVGCDKIPNDMQQLKFLQKSKMFRVSDSGYVSLVEVRGMKLDYKSILCPKTMCKTTTIEMHVEDNKPADSDNIPVKANSYSYCTEKHKKSSETDYCNKFISSALKFPTTVNDKEEAVNYDFLRNDKRSPISNGVEDIHLLNNRTNFSIDPVTIKNASNETTSTLSEPNDIWCKDELMYEKLCASVLFLLHAFGPLNCEHLKKCISYMFPECGMFLNELSKERQRELFLSIPSTLLDNDFLKLTASYEFDTKYISKGKMRELFIISYLALNGKTNFMKVLEELYHLAPEVTIVAFSDAKDSRWYSFLKNASKYFKMVSRRYLTLTPSFYETDDKDQIQLSENPLQGENNALAFSENHGLHTESETSNNYDLMSCSFESRVPNQIFQNSSPHSNFDKQNKETFEFQSTKAYNETDDILPTRLTLCKIRNIHNEESENVEVGGNCNSSPEKILVLENDVPIEAATSVVHQNAVDTKNRVTVLEYSQDVLNLLSERMIDGIAYILKFFEFNIYTGFLEKVLHLIKRGHHFFRLPPSQQEEVIKNCFSAFCIDEHGNVASTFSNKKLTFILSKAKSMAMCMSYIISKKGSMHYAEVFKYYHKCVGWTNFQQNVKQLEYFRNRQYIYQVCDNGYVSLVKVRAIEWDYVSTLTTRRSCETARICASLFPKSVEPETTNISLKQQGLCSKDGLIYKKFCASVTFLLHSFGKLHCSQLTEYISYVLGDVGICMDALSQEKRQELFLNIPSTELKENTVRLKTLYELDTTYLSQNKLRLLYTISYLDLHGKTHIVKLLDRLHRSSPQLSVNNLIYFENSKYFELDSGNYLTLPSFFYFTACVNLFRIPQIVCLLNNETSRITSEKNFDIQKQFKELGNIPYSKIGLLKQTEHKKIDDKYGSSIQSEISVLKSSVSNISNGIPQICNAEMVKQEICMTDRICTIVREGIVFLFEEFKCPFDFHLACVVIHALHEAKRPFLLLSQSDQIALIKKILAPLWVAEVEDNSGTFLRSSLETFQLNKEQRDLLFISYVVSRYEKLHFSTLLGVFEKHHMDTKVLMETDVYFLPRSPFFSIDQNRCITLESFPPAKWMIEHLASVSSINSDLPWLSIDQFKISQAVDENLPVCHSLALKSIATNKEAIGKRVISKFFKCPTKEMNTANAKKYPLDVLYLLGERMYDGVAYLMKYFELHIYSEFLENVLHVAKMCSLFLELSTSQQEEVIKASLCDLRIDEHGRMTSTVAKYPKRQLTNAVKMALCMSFMISQRGPMHYRELFKYYQKCVGRTKILHDSNQKQYFHSQNDIFFVCDSGFVSIVNVPVIELNYVAILMSSGLCNPSNINTHIEGTGVKNSVNSTVIQNNADSCDVDKGRKMDMLLVEDNSCLPKFVECNTKLKGSESVASGTLLNIGKPDLTPNEIYDLKAIKPENAAANFSKLEDNPMIQECGVLPKLDSCDTKLQESSVNPGILETNQVVSTDHDNFNENTGAREHDSFTHLDYFVPIAFSNKNKTEDNKRSQINSSLVYETFPELQSTQPRSCISENFKQEPLCSNIVDSFVGTPYVDRSRSGSSEICDKTVVKCPNIPLKFNLLELQSDGEPFYDNSKASKSNIKKNIFKCDCSIDLTKECRAINFFIIILSQSKIGFSVPILEKKLLLASKEVQHYISCVYKGSILNFLQNHDTFYISSTTANVCLKK